MKDIIERAFSYWLKNNIDDTKTRQIMARSIGWQYEEIRELPHTEDIDIFIITNKKLISPSIEYLPLHRSSHLIHTFDFDNIKNRLIKRGRLTIGGDLGSGKTTLSYLIIRSLPRPFWLIKLKSNVHIDADVLERFALATDMPILLFADKDIYKTNIGGIKPSDVVITLMLDRHGDVNLGPHSQEAARYMAEEILKAPVPLPSGRKQWIEIALYIRNKRRNPEFADNIWNESIEYAWNILLEELPEEALFLLITVAKEKKIAAPKKLIKLQYPKTKNFKFIEKLISLGILHRDKQGRFTLSHPYWIYKINDIINMGKNP